jgi:hypothetical protein
MTTTTKLFLDAGIYRLILSDLKTLSTKLWDLKGIGVPLAVMSNSLIPLILNLLSNGMVIPKSS